MNGHDWLPLARGQFARLVFGLWRSKATGVLTASQGATRSEVLVLRRGDLMVPQADALGRRATRLLETVCSWNRLRYHWDGGLAAYPPGQSSRPFNLGQWARRHYESQLDGATATRLASELAGARLSLRPGVEIPPSLCDATDRRILQLLAAPRRLDQIWPMARCPKFRMLALIYFLRQLGALEERGVAAPAEHIAAPSDAHRLLGVERGTDPATIKRAYRRRVRALHPDLQPSLSDAERRALETRLAEVNRAYQELVGLS